MSANEHDRLELQLARAQERHRTLVEQIPAIVYTFEVGGRWRYVSEIPIIVISAQATPGSIQRILANGANAYLTKPLDVHEVLEVVDAFLDRPAETPGLPDPTEAVG